ncbi:O-antigen ligase family protein [Bdellovibrio sp. HCB185ZH]|uniref:O-antigen ligase family protein n=1 Tax=Bdellovibrio sp. HCB185ZH TaxID=3394235 RepID=UPI0039A6CE69
MSSKVSEKIWTGLWVLFALSMFVSKSGLSIFGTILILWSIFKTDWKFTVRQNPWFAVLVSFFPLAILVSFFSLAGTEAALNVVGSWSWPLYVIPFALLFADKKLLKIFGWALAVGMVLGCVKAIEVFGTKWGWHFNSQTRVDSFWDIGRWAYFLSCSAAILFALVGSKSFPLKASRFEKFALPVLFILSLVFLILVNARGPWLAAVGSIGLLGISGKRYFKFLGAFLVIVVASLFAVPGTMDRLQSSFSAKKENGVITSSDASNAARLHMWKVNSEFFQEQVFFGTGLGAAETPLRAFLAKQTPEYVAKYVDREFSFHDQHDSYLLILVQMGLIFCVVLWGCVFWIVIRSIPSFFTTENVMVKIAFALAVNQLFTFIFYSSITSYEALWFFPVLLLLGQELSRKRSAKLA